MSRSALNVPDVIHQSQAGLPQCLWRDNEVSGGSLCIYRNASRCVMALEVIRSEVAGFSPSLLLAANTVAEMGTALLAHLQYRQGWNSPPTGTQVED